MAMLTGVFTRKVFSNWENKYHVYSFQPVEGREETVIYFGENPPTMNGHDYVIRGYKKRSPKYGMQFILKAFDLVEDYQRKTESHLQRLYEILA